MPFVPLPFVVALVLLILMALAGRRDGVRANPFFLALIAVCVLQSVLLGLRWGYGVAAVRNVLPISAAALPPLVYASFRGLTQRASSRGQAGLWPHALPAAFVAVLVVLRRDLIDIALVLIYLGYAAALLRLARPGPDMLRLALLEGALPAYRALQLAAAVLAASAGVDGLVALDFELTRGAHAVAVIGIANLFSLFILGLAMAVAGRSQPPIEPEVARDSVPTADTEDDAAIIAKIEELMQGRKLYRDADLSLDRLGRRAGLPARRISAAINRITSKNVSQYVNDHRVAEACRLLTETTKPVTMIMFEVGFQTKSNFNREFRRVMGTSPSAWRAAQAGKRAMAKDGRPNAAVNSG
jgi:AraC-like DNA-binding protein